MGRVVLPLFQGEVRFSGGGGLGKFFPGGGYSLGGGG